MCKTHLIAIVAALAGAASLLQADIMSESRPATQPASHPGQPWSAAPPSAAEFPVHDETVDDDQVLQAIKRGVDYLLSLRKGDNFEVGGTPWTKGPTEKAGETALIVYALLHVNESVSDDDLRQKLNFKSAELAPVITYLKNAQPDGTYAAGLIACALTLMPRTKDIVAALDRPQGARAYLISATNENGGYEYGVPGATSDAAIADQEKKIADLRAKLAAPGKKDVKGLTEQIKQAVAALPKLREAATNVRKADRKNWNPDGSNTQYGVLGAWALSDYGLPMPPGYWTSQDHYWRRVESPEGTFPYNKEPRSTSPSMAAAGVATLFITQEFIDLTPTLTPRNDKQLEAAISNVADTFDGKSTNQYYHYGIERVGLASGLKFFGTHDWYRELAQTLIHSQNKDGSWSPGGFYAGPAANNGNTIATSYALLTLARGRNPVLINKLSYEGPWNARSRDAARLAEKLSRSFERPLNWQVVSQVISPENWTDAPILLITGSEDPKFSPALVEKLKAYTEMGGIIFSSADGDKPEFTEAMKKYAAQIAPGRQMRELPPNHPILNGELWAKVKNPPKLLGLSNGIREIWVHSTVDMGAVWYKKDYDAEASWVIPGNLYFYATGKANLKSRLQSTVVHAPDTVPGPTLTVGQLMVGDNPDPEPGAWPRMARLMRVCCHTNVQITKVTLGDLAKTDPPPPPAIHFTGTTAFKLSDAEIATLRAYLTNGGTLLADSGGMSPAFTSSFIEMTTKLYPKNPLTPLRETSAIYRGGYPNAKPIGSVRYRPYYSLKNGFSTAPKIQVVQPKPGGRYTILFSEPDLTSGLLGTNTWGINGYAPESAQALARNLLLYTLANAPPASTQPASQPATRPATK